MESNANDTTAGTTGRKIIMTLMNPTTPTELLPQPNNNGAGTVPAPVVVAAAAALAIDPELAKKMEAIQDLGKDIKKREREKAKQETTCAKTKAQLDSEREVLHKIEHTLEELHDELATLAVGKNSERLPFGEAGKSENKSLGDKPTSAVSDAWRSVALSTLTPAIKPAKLKVLSENTPQITTLGELADWQAKKGEFWCKDLKGMGDGGREQIEKACEAYYAANPIQVTPPAPVDGAPFDDEAIKMETAESVIKHPACFADIAQRAGGKWASRFGVTLGKNTIKCEGDTWIGSHPSRIHVIATLIDAVYDYVDGMRAKLTGKPKKQANEIIAKVDALDRDLAQQVDAPDVADDIKAFWAERVNKPAEEVKAEKKAKRDGKH